MRAQGESSLNILQVCGWWEVTEQGGVTSVMADLMGRLVTRHNVKILTSDWDSPRLSTKFDGEQYYFRLRLPPPPSGANIKQWIGFLVRFPLAVFRLAAFCRREKIDVAHLHYLSPYQLCFAAARLLGGPPYILTIHRGDILAYPESTASRRTAMRIAMRHAERVTTVSDWLARTTTDLAGVRPKPAVVYNGLTLDIADVPDRAALEAGLGRPLPPGYAVLVANMRPYKGHDTALRAWRKLLDEGIDLPLVLAGGGPDFATMRSFARDLELPEEKVVFLGPCPRAVSLGLIRAADFLVAPSRNEGQGLVILEAASLDTPVIASDIAPFLEMIEDGKNSYVFRVDDVDDMVRAVSSAFAEPDEAKARARRLAAHVNSMFSLEAMATRYEEIYQGVIKG